jgi:hypothetical protein
LKPSFLNRRYTYGADLRKARDTLENFLGSEGEISAVLSMSIEYAVQPALIPEPIFHDDVLVLHIVIIPDAHFSDTNSFYLIQSNLGPILMYFWYYAVIASSLLCFPLFLFRIGLESGPDAAEASRVSDVLFENRMNWC